MSSSFTYTMLILASLIVMSYGQYDDCLAGCSSCNATGYCLQCEEEYALDSGMCYTTYTNCSGGCQQCYYMASETCQSCVFGTTLTDPVCSGMDAATGCKNWNPCSLDWWIWLIVGLIGCLIIWCCYRYKCCTSARRAYSVSLVTVCPTCKGGKYFQIQNDVVAIREDCFRCKGTGYI